MLYHDRHVRAEAERDARVGRAKDTAAGAVLVAAIASAVIGALVFGPRLIARLTG